VSNQIICLVLLFPNNHCIFVVSLKSQFVTSNSCSVSAHNQDVLHHIACVNVVGIFQDFIDTFSSDDVPPNIVDIIDDQFVD
jgi:hypothetical protein